MLHKILLFRILKPCLKLTNFYRKILGVLYRVRATYRYQKEDVDELSFEAGEIIRVIEYDEPEEQVCEMKQILILLKLLTKWNELFIIV